MINYEKLMKKCLLLAQKGEGNTSPNPLVGAILVDDEGQIISSGYHQKYGEAHAEVNAIKSACGKLKGATLVVNLEPCSHYGKTPPCADLIIKSGIKKVVIGTKDINPLVAGRGIKKLKDAGVEVVEGVLEFECKKLNEIFFKNQLEKKVFVASKVAQTLDGKIALENRKSKWITSSRSRNLVQKIRYKYDCILTSSGTILADNPSLTIRKKPVKNLSRVILDKNLVCPFSSKVFNDDGCKIFLFTNKKSSNFPKYINLIQTPLKNGNLDLNFVCEELYKNGIRSVLIEAGGRLNQAFLAENLIDKIHLFIAPKLFADKNAINSFYGQKLESIEKSISLSVQKIKFINPDIYLELS